MIRILSALWALPILLGVACSGSGKVSDSTPSTESDADSDADADADSDADADADSDADADADTSVYLNEMQAADSSNVQDWIELVNVSSAAVDLSGWQLGDGIDSGKTPWTFPSGMTVPANGYLLIYADGGDTGDTSTDFKLDKDGDQVWLLNPDGAIVDTTTLSGLAPDQTWARIPDATGSWTISNSPTPSATNAP